MSQICLGLFYSYKSKFNEILPLIQIFKKSQGDNHIQIYPPFLTIIILNKKFYTPVVQVCIDKIKNPTDHFDLG